MAVQTRSKMGKGMRRRAPVGRRDGADTKMLDSNTFDLDVSKKLAPDGLFQRAKKNE